MIFPGFKPSFWIGCSVKELERNWPDPGDFGVVGLAVVVVGREKVVAATRVLSNKQTKIDHFQDLKDKSMLVMMRDHAQNIRRLNDDYVSIIFYRFKLVQNLIIKGKINFRNKFEKKKIKR